MKWNMISTGDIALHKGGSVDPKKHQDEVFELYSIPAFDAGAPEVVAGSAIGSSKKAVQPNDVMISRIVPHIRRACVVGPAKGHRQIASGEWIIFRDECIWPKYLRWQLVGDVFHSAFMRTVSGVGGSLLRARPAEVFKIQIPLPPLAEQKRIARILDAADALRAKRREALAQLDTLLQSTFLDMFGDADAHPSIGEMLSGGTLELHKDGNHGSLYPRAHEFGESGVAFLSARSISELGDLLPTEIQFLNEGKARALKLGWIEDGDVLLAHNASVGKTFLYRGEFHEALIGTSLTAFRPNPEALDSAYLLGALRSQRFQQQLFANMGQTTRNQVPITAQRRLTIPLPSLHLQHRFATIVESVEHQKASQRTHLDELDTLFASLQSRAFRGDL